MKHNKTPEANLEPKRKVYFQLGFAVALSVVLAAFEWTGYDYEEIKYTSYVGDPIMEEEIIPFNRPDKPTPPKLKSNTNILVIVPADPPIGDPDPNPDPNPDQFQIDFENIFTFGDGGEEYDDDETDIIFITAEVMPYYDQCKNVVDRDVQKKCTEDEIINFVLKNVRYPKLCVEAGIQGKVYVSFIIDKTGAVREAKIERGVHKLIDKNCLDVVNSLPVFNPATQQGKAVSVYYNIPINFSLNK